MSIRVGRRYARLDSAPKQVTRGVRRRVGLAGVENSLIAWLAGEEKRDSFLCFFVYALGWQEKRFKLRLLNPIYIDLFLLTLINLGCFYFT